MSPVKKLDFSSRNLIERWILNNRGVTLTLMDWFGGTTIIQWCVEATLAV